MSNIVMFNIIKSSFIRGNLDLVGRCDGKADRKKKNQFYNIFEHKNGGAGLGIFFL